MLTRAGCLLTSMRLNLIRIRSILHWIVVEIFQWKKLLCCWAPVTTETATRRTSAMHWMFGWGYHATKFMKKNFTAVRWYYDRYTYFWWFGMTEVPFCWGFPLNGNGLAVLKHMPRLWLQLLCGIGGGCPGGGGKKSAQLVGTEVRKNLSPWVKWWINQYLVDIADKPFVWTVWFGYCTVVLIRKWVLSFQTWLVQVLSNFHFH